MLSFDRALQERAAARRARMSEVRVDLPSDPAHGERGAPRHPTRACRVGGSVLPQTLQGRRSQIIRPQVPGYEASYKKSPPPPTGRASVMLITCSHLTIDVLC